MAKEATNPMQFDKRVVERHIKKGVVTRESYDKYLSGLSDVAEQAETIRAKLGDEDLEDDLPEEDDEDDVDGEESDDDAG